MKKMDEVKSHEFDGIQEYDNDLPRWWLGTFVLSVLFGFGYWFYYHNTSKGPTLAQELQADLKSYQTSSQSSNQLASISEEDIKNLISDKAVIAKAQEVYIQNCMACHGMQGQGVIGPNLTDTSWIHGGKPEQVYSIIVAGVPAKGMPTWKGVIGDAQIRGLVAYISTLKGTNPPNAKAAEGIVE